MSTYADGFCPARDGFRDLLKDDGFSEDGTAQDVTDLRGQFGSLLDWIEPETNGSIWTSPHFFQVEFFHSSLVWGDGSAFDTDRVFLDRFGTINGNLVVGLILSCFIRPGEETYRITGLHTQIVVFEVDIDVGQDELCVNAARPGRPTSSRIFFQMIRVISSPSSSTTGFLTLIRSIPAGVA